MTADRSCVATLVARQGPATIGAALLRDLGAALGAQVAPWLDPGTAVDLLFSAPETAYADLKARIAARLDGLPIDVAVQPTEGRRKRLFLADMDSTMIGQECIDELADIAGLKERVAPITERAMRGEIAFEPALRERVALLEGLPVSVVETVLAQRITMTPGGPVLLRTMRANGTYCALVSGGFTLFTGPIAHKLGFDEHRSNILIVDDGRLAGRVCEPILGRDAKRDRLVELRANLGIGRAATLAVGDGANDLAMVGEAGLGVAFRAKPAVAAAAQARIDHTDLDTLLFFQGYRRDEFVAATPPGT